MLVEQAPGPFYRKSRAYLHFHEDPSGTFAVVRLNGDQLTRVRATTPDEQAHVVTLIADSVSS